MLPAYFLFYLALLSLHKIATAVSIATIAALATIPVYYAHAALPPESIQQMKDEADHLLLIQVTENKYRGQKRQGGCGLRKYYDSSAKVLLVNRTSNEHPIISNGEITIETYEYSVWTCVGPNAPGVKEEGWCGYVYLDPSQNREGVYVPAAPRESYEIGDSERICAEYGFEPNGRRLRNGGFVALSIGVLSCLVLL